MVAEAPSASGLRILFVSHYALPHLGGIEAAVDAMARELTGRGHEVVHVASAAVRRDEPPGPPEATSYRVIRVPAVNAMEDLLESPYPLFGPRLVSELRRELGAADVVHAHGFIYMSSVVAMALARRRGRPPARVLTEHVGHVHYENPVLDRGESAAIATLGRVTTRAAGALVWFNEKVREELAALAPGTRLERIENGVDTDRYRPPEDGERDRL